MKPSQKHADKIFYEIAGTEIESGEIDKGLMVKAGKKKQNCRPCVYISSRNSDASGDGIIENHRVMALLVFTSLYTAAIV